MPHSTQIQSRSTDKTKLLLKFNYASCFLSAAFGMLCLFYLHIEGIIPYVFFGYIFFNLLNVVAFKKHGNLAVMAIITSLLSLLSALFIIVNSGGINSPFLFVLAIIVLAGYVSTRLLGKIYLYIILALIAIIYYIGVSEYNFITNEVPESGRALFSLLSILFSIYLLGAVFGKDLLKAHHKLYASKAEIEKQIHEKETLLKEIHHRVKNNLQTVSSLLSLQSRNTSNQQIKTIIKSSQNRVISMAMIHEMLYTNANLSKIEFRSYVEELATYLIRSVRDTADNIDLKIDIPDIQLGIDTAIPLGLLINETITNSLKYGFEKDGPGEITIALKKELENKNDFLLTISDNGIGFSDEIDHKTTKSLGIKLIHNLARQLQGSAVKDTTRTGTTYLVKFKDLTQSLNTMV